MRKVLLIIGICIIWSNTLCAQITVSPRTEKMELVNLLHKKRNPYSLYQKRDSIRLARFEHRRNVESYLKSRELRKETVKIDIASCAKQLRSSGITSKIVNETTAGTLSSYFTDEEKSSISSLTITGKMDARDFKFLRDYFKGSSKN